MTSLAFATKIAEVFANKAFAKGKLNVLKADQVKASMRILCAPDNYPTTQAGI